MPSASKRHKPSAVNPFPGGIAIVGMGRWGSSLCAGLLRRGMQPAELVVRDPSSAALRKKKHNSGRGSDGVMDDIVSFTRARLDAEVLWLCVPDRDLIAVAEAVVRKRRSLRGQVMLHSSGVGASSILTAAEQAGARVGSVHPLMSFPTRAPVELTGVPFAVEAAGRLAGRLERLVTLLGGQPFRISAAGKPLYHAAAVMASPLLVSLASATQQMAVEAGLSMDEANALLLPIMSATLQNFFRHGAARSFSGPFARGDVETVSLHLAALQVHPSMQQIYKALAAHALDALPGSKKRGLRKALTSSQPNILG